MGETVLAIDPGPKESAWVIYAGGNPVDFSLDENEMVCKKIKYLREHKSFCRNQPEHLAIEMIASYGMPVGKSVFETCVWIGRFIESWSSNNYTLIYRKQVSVHLCGSARAKDSNIRQAIMDRYEPTGGGKTPVVGVKKKPGPLYGIRKDIWAALAVAITWDDMAEEETK